MTKEELFRYIRLLRDKKGMGKLISFVGAGVSCNVEGLPLWEGLIKKMAQAINYTRCDQCGKKEGCEGNCVLKDTYSSDEYLKIPQYVHNSNQELYKKILRENIKNIDVDAPLSNEIIALSPTHIITTNYDNLLETCKLAQQGDFDVIKKDLDLLDTKNRRYIIKMHGDIEQQESIVLKEDDYLQYSQKHILIETFVKSLLTDNIILFLGYSLNDYNIKMIISWINSLRAYNDGLKDQKFAYIVLDKDKISEREKAYFNNNNIDIINIRNICLVKNIPQELSDSRGKRLYSFLKTINNPALDRLYGVELIYDNVIEFFDEYVYVDARSLCEALLGTYYQQIGDKLQISSKEQYDSLVKYLESDTSNAKKLKQLLVNVGIKNIYFTGNFSEKSDFYSITDFENKLLSNTFYKEYLSNDYISLYHKVKDVDFSFEQAFYKTLIRPYDQDIVSGYKKMKFNSLNNPDRVRYLFNYNSLEAHFSFVNKSNDVQNYINTIPQKKYRDMSKKYLDIYAGNHEKSHRMNDMLKKIKEVFLGKTCYMNNNAGINYLLSIKKDALEEYMFYFNNALFFRGYSDLKTLLKIYVEALICMGVSIDKDAPEQIRYQMDAIDIDILTKFISVKELTELFNAYQVQKLRVREDIGLLQSFTNLIDLFIKLPDDFLWYEITAIFTNYILLFEHIEFDNKFLKTVEKKISELLESDNFIIYFFSINDLNFRKNIEVLSNFLSLFEFNGGFRKLKSIIKQLSKDYNTRIINKNILNKIIKALMKKEDHKHLQQDIYEFICSFDNQEKIFVIQLLMNFIIDKEIKRTLQDFIVDNYQKLDTSDIFNLYFSNWLDISDENVNVLFSEVLQLYDEKTRKKGITIFPDPLNDKLEMIYILYITGRITDISSLESISEKDVFLKFFLNSDKFDYSQVDFSHYMWENIGRQKRFQEKFISHKEDVLPKLEMRANQRKATNFEYKMLYGILKKDEELF